MRSFSELESVIAQEKVEFQNFIRQELEKDEHFLGRRFPLANGEQSTVLNYLVRRHEPSKGRDLSNRISWLLKHYDNASLDQPLHLMMRLRKTALFPIFLNFIEVDERGRYQLQLDHRDNEGQTLISRALATGQINCVQTLIELNVDLHEASRMKFAKKTMDLQPLHQSIFMNFSSATAALIRAGAPVENPCGPLKETPLLLASKYGKIDALATLVSSCADKLDLEYENTKRMRAIDLLCLRLQKGANVKKTMRGIAILLCHGAEAPRSEEFCSLLEDHRLDLLEAVKKYTRISGCQPTKFVRACHDRNTRLHDIIYATNSWFESLKRMLGFSSREAYIVESLVYDLDSLDHHPAEGGSLEELPEPEPSSASQNSFSKEERQFAEFAWRYSHSFNGFFKNPFSTMHWMINSGECTSIEEVYHYVEEHHQESPKKKIRSEQLLEAMDGKKTLVHDDLMEPQSGFGYS